MVKSIIYTLTAIALSIGFFIFTESYVNGQFEDFYGAVEALYQKVETKSANREDAYAVREMWAEKKSSLHVFIPHNDISYVDYWLNEACGFIYTGHYDLALSNLEVLKEIARTLPSAYSIKLENVF